MGHSALRRASLCLLLLPAQSYAVELLDASNFTHSQSFILNTTGIPVACWAPISGNYGLLPRVLFYLIISFALLASHFEWLIAGALAAALTYSGSAAIHGCLLAWRGPARTELDVIPLAAILSTSCLITVPLINWSTTLRNLGSRPGQTSSARIIIIYWAALVFIGLISTLAIIWSPHYYIATIAGEDPLVCNPPQSQMNYYAGQDPSWTRFKVDAEWVEENSCANPCHQSRYIDLAPIFRSYSDWKLLSRADYLVLDNILAAKSFLQAYIFVGTVCITVLLSQGIWALLFGRRSPHQVRDFIYCGIQKISIKRASRNSVSESGTWRPFWKAVAKYVATLAYIWAVLASLLSFLLFFANIIILEALLLAYIPESEPSTHVGAWSPWTSTALVVLAAFISKYHKVSINSFLQRCRLALYRIGFLKRPGNQSTRIQPVAEETDDKSSSDESNAAASVHQGPHYTRVNTMRLLKDRTIEGVRKVQDEWAMLKVFWRDPDRATGLLHQTEAPLENDSTLLLDRGITIPESCIEVDRSPFFDQHAANGLN